MTGSSERPGLSNAGSLPGASALVRLTEQVKLGHQAWMERLAQMQAVEAEFAKELTATQDPAEALKICNRWIGKRLELLAADSKAFTGFWMDLVVAAAGELPSAGTQTKKGEDA